MVDHISFDLADLCSLLFFNHFLSSMWQQAGRSGRRGKPSLSIYVAFEGPLDQYFMKFPNKLFRGSIECCHVDPNNDQVYLHAQFCFILYYAIGISIMKDGKW